MDERCITLHMDEGTYLHIKRFVIDNGFDSLGDFLLDVISSIEDEQAKKTACNVRRYRNK